MSEFERKMNTLKENKARVVNELINETGVKSERDLLHYCMRRRGEPADLRLSEALETYRLGMGGLLRDKIEYMHIMDLEDLAGRYANLIRPSMPLADIV